jgi:hypothetical protein
LASFFCVQFAIKLLSVNKIVAASILRGSHSILSAINPKRLLQSSGKPFYFLIYTLIPPDVHNFRPFLRPISCLVLVHGIPRRLQGCIRRGFAQCSYISAPSSVALYCFICSSASGTTSLMMTIKLSLIACLIAKSIASDSFLITVIFLFGSAL